MNFWWLAAAAIARTSKPKYLRDSRDLTSVNKACSLPAGVPFNATIQSFSLEETAAAGAIVADTPQGRILA